MSAAVKLVQALAGWKGYAAVGLIAGGLASGAAWTAQGWRKDVQIARLQRDQQQARADANADVLETIKGDINSIAAAAARAAVDAGALPARVGEITKALKNAKPLLAGCRPDDVRVRSLTDAVRAARDTAAGQPPSRALSTNTGSTAKP